MRVYLAGTWELLRSFADRGTWDVDVAYAVTPALREWYASGDAEELEYAALWQAARASLRLLADDDASPPRRVVIAADVNSATPDAAAGRAVVRLGAPVQLQDAVSVHVDDETAEAAVRAAIDALAAADEGDDDAQFTLDTLDDYELAWYSAQEIPHLL